MNKTVAAALHAALLGLLGTAAFPAATVWACGAIPTPYVTLGDALPTAGTRLPRDGAVIIRARLWADAGGPFHFADLRLLDQGGQVIPAVEVPWYSEPPSLALHPAAPLPAGTALTLAATVPGDAPMPAGAEGPQQTTVAFAIGDDLAPALALAGPLRVQLERFEADVIRCAGTNCGQPDATCTKVGTRPALRARITVPAAHGGVDFDGYRGWIHFTDNRPATFRGAGEAERPTGQVSLMHWLNLRPDAETEILQEISDEELAYAPCFAMNLWDPAGHAVQPAPVCLPSFKASEYLRAQDAAGDAGGCSVAANRGGGRGSLVLVLFAGAALGLRSRRRSGAAVSRAPPAQP
jgi:hypothetical protein